VSQPSLRRSVGPFLLTLYGLGNIVGAGIYVLLGEVAGAAGSTAPLAFLLAMAVAALSALTYGELAAYYPRASGEAVYLDRAFGLRTLSLGAGLAIAVAGIVSAAALARGFAGYFAELIPVPNWVGIVGIVGILTGVAVWGIQQSLRASAVMTVLQVAGLLMVIAGLSDALGELPDRAGELLPGMAVEAWMGLWIGGFLAFYAFIGFEDMVKIAEEVRRPRRDMPLAVLAALGGAALLYLVLAAGVVLALDPATLAGTEAPLAVIYEATTGRGGEVITLFGLVATLSGVLAQLIMASRLLYGLAEEGWLPGVLARVSPRTRTPIPATLIVAGIILILALAFPVAGLAGMTSALILAVFAGVNLGLWGLRRQHPDWGVGIAPRWVPPTALLATLFLAGGGLASLMR